MAASAAVVAVLVGVGPVRASSNCLQTGVPNERRVCSAAELEAVLRSDFSGRILVPPQAHFDMSHPCGAHDEFGNCVATPMRELPLKSGVQLVGERGALARRPVVFTDLKAGDEHYPLFQVVGDGVRIEGLHLIGPEHFDRRDRDAKVDAIEVVEDAAHPPVRGVVIADDELEQWPDAGVAVSGTVREEEASASYTGPRMRPRDAGLVRVERNYIHDNARDGAGYGVEVDGSAYVTIEGNVFDSNRHDVSADYLAYKGYVARFNYLLEGGFTYPTSDPSYWGQHFDAHGSGTAESRKHGHYDGGSAGEFFQIAFNAIRGAQTYGAPRPFERTRAAFELRGRPSIGAEFTDNVLVHGSFGSAVRLVAGVSYPTLDPRFPSTFAIAPARNRYDSDHSKDIAAGDFDGDGRTDVFVATGTAWFFSRAGEQPWELLHESTKLTRQLAFADIDNDGATDVLYRDPIGRLGYLKSGRVALVPLTTEPVPIGDLRFGDFDGDGKTDIFYTRAHQWHVWFGRDRRWRDTGTSGVPVTQLLFGSFDAVAGTDVAAVVNGGWSFSSASTHPWAPLNRSLVSSFAGATAADFDGNGRTDIAFGAGKTWRVSLDGRGPLRTLRDGADAPPLRTLLIGHFDALTPPAQVTGFVGQGRRLGVWHGLGGDGTFTDLSRQPMR